MIQQLGGSRIEQKGKGVIALFIQLLFKTQR